MCSGNPPCVTVLLNQESTFAIPIPVSNGERSYNISRKGLWILPQFIEWKK